MQVVAIENVRNIHEIRIGAGEPRKRCVDGVIGVRAKPRDRREGAFQSSPNTLAPPAAD